MARSGMALDDADEMVDGAGDGPFDQPAATSAAWTGVCADLPLDLGGDALDQLGQPGFHQSGQSGGEVDRAAG